MSGISGDWAALASGNERLAGTSDDQPRSADANPVSTLPARWAELASHRERLVGLADPLCELASSSPGTGGYRLAVSAA
ncbi:MAG TPA: hypothetical protein VK823_30345 [Streptosporangiaceae bacterium]|jgi:hypothetical protein|nr:hypothetical protein [Streptosporangiaceae bacterium]